VGLGGTFDELHKGHRALLKKAFAIGTQIQIGLCTDEFAKKLRKNHKIAPYEERKKELEDFLKKNKIIDRVKIIPIADSYGPAVTDNNIEAIVVSQETEPTAQAINAKRKENGLQKLQIIVIDMVPAENQVDISTTRIRHGEIDREGRLTEKKKKHYFFLGNQV
jgi:pantetheine-phosphate adenylyltransferase